MKMRKNVAIVEGEDPDYDDDGSGWTVVKTGKPHYGGGERGKQSTKNAILPKSTNAEKKKELAKRHEEARGILESTAVFQTTTIYEQFDQALQKTEEQQKRKDEKRIQKEKEESEEERIQEERKIEFHSGLQDDTIQHPKLKKNLKKVPKKLNLAEVRKSIEQQALQISIEKIMSDMYSWRESYPKDGNIQLKKLAEYMERTFQKAKAIEYDEKEEGGHPWWSKRDIPYSVIPTQVVDEVAQWIGGLEEKDIAEFTWFLFQTWISTAGKKERAINGVGILSLLQIIIRKFPYTMAEITPLIQAQYTSKSKTGDVLFKKQDVMHIMTVLAQSLETNPRISIYGWFELLLPPLFNQSPDPFLCDVIVTYIGHLESFCKEKNWFKVPINSSKEYYTSPEKFVALIQFLNSEAKSKNLDKLSIQSRLKAVFPKLTEATVFFSADSPRIYFPKILSIVVKPEETEETEETEEESQPSTKTQSARAVLNILAISLLKSPQCSPLLVKYYAHYHAQSNYLLSHLLANWEKLFDNVKGNRKQEVIKELIEVCKTIMDTNLKLRDNRYQEDGKKIGVRVLNISRDQLTVVDNTCKEFLQLLGKSAKKVQKQQAQNSGGRGLYLFLLVVLILVVVGVGYVTAKTWVGEVIFQFVQKTKKEYL